ncbi:MAG: methylenetetrahydrofolate reductase C-terminal domain-containing protein [Candidatus Micrarchaeota archaeon]
MEESAETIVERFSRACPKNMKNGPCGGVRNGKCEVSGRGACVWCEIYKQVSKDEFLKVRE